MELRMRRLFALVIVLLLAVAPCAFAQAQTDEPAHPPQAGDEWTEPITGMEFVWVPGGCYEMGCGEWAGDHCYEDEFPVHEVCIDGFWLGKYEVTRAQWRTIMGDYPRPTQRGDQYPIDTISWNDTQMFAFRITAISTPNYNYRLPTEAEWEFACRSGGQEETYSGSDTPNRVCWSEDNTEWTQPIGTKEPNSLGIYDMSGNAWELVQDCYNKYSYSSHSRENPIDRSCDQDEKYHVIRGGGYNFGHNAATCSNRMAIAAERRRNFVSFRLAFN